MGILNKRVDAAINCSARYTTNYFMTREPCALHIGPG